MREQTCCSGTPKSSPMPSTRKVVFAGKTLDGDEEIVLYVEEPVEDPDVQLLSPTNRRSIWHREFFIKLPNGEVWALSSQTTIVAWENEDDDSTHVKIDSPQWTGIAKGTREDLIRAEEGLT